MVLTSGWQLTVAWRINAASSTTPATGRSAASRTATPLPMAQAMDYQRQMARIQECKAQLMKLPYGDLRFFTTTIAMQDFDAVREALGALD